MTGIVHTVRGSALIVCIIHETIGSGHADIAHQNVDALISNRSASPTRRLGVTAPGFSSAFVESSDIQIIFRRRTQQTPGKCQAFLSTLVCIMHSRSVC